MLQPARITLVSLALVALDGCVPTTSSLVQARRYDDAICHTKNDAEAALVVAAVERDADLRFHL
jgi:hypothetical protein